MNSSLNRSLTAVAVVLALGAGYWAGSRHDAHSPNGALVLSFFLKPNKFFDQA